MSAKGKTPRGKRLSDAEAIAKVRARSAEYAARRWQESAAVLHNVALDRVHAQALDKVWRHFGCATRAESVRRCIEIAAAGLDGAKK